jgi:hypothetical protein
MKQSQHTPGPWEIRADPCHYDSFTTVVAGSVEQRKGLLRELIVEVGGCADIEVAEANARLIAAAPAMYELLSDIMDELRRACRDAIETGNREGSSLPAKLERRIYDIIEEVTK